MDWSFKPSSGALAVFAENKSLVIKVKKSGWTAIYVQNSFQAMKRTGHKNCGLVKCYAARLDEGKHVTEFEGLETLFVKLSWKPRSTQ